MLRSVVCVLACLIASCAGVAAQAKPAKERVTFKLPGVEINFREKYVDVEGSVCLRAGLLELVVCTKGSKEHESIIAISARPMHVHAALLLVGADPGHPAMLKLVDEKEDRWVPVPARGSPVDAYLVFPGRDGKPVERPVSDFITRQEAGKDGTLVKRSKFPTHTFLFAGSRLVDTKRGPQKYVCDRSGNVISIVTFGDELLCLSGGEEESNGPSPWEVDATHLPKVGSRATLRLRPRLESSREASQKKSAPPPESERR